MMIDIRMDSTDSLKALEKRCCSVTMGKRRAKHSTEIQILATSSEFLALCGGWCIVVDLNGLGYPRRCLSLDGYVCR